MDDRAERGDGTPRCIGAGLIRNLFAAGLAIALCACAADYVHDSGTALPAETYRADVAACEQEAAAANPLEGTALGFLGGAAWGGLHGASYGAVWGDVGDGALIGASAGAVIGSIVGLVGGNQDQRRLMESCMSGRGYRAG